MWGDSGGDISFDCTEDGPGTNDAAGVLPAGRLFLMIFGDGFEYFDEILGDSDVRGAE